MYPVFTNQRDWAAGFQYMEIAGFHFLRKQEAPVYLIWNPLYWYLCPFLVQALPLFVQALFQKNRVSVYRTENMATVLRPREQSIAARWFWAAGVKQYSVHGVLAYWNIARLALQDSYLT